MTTPTINNQQKLSIQIIKHEGKEKFVYKDSLGYWSIGVGRNIDNRCEKGLSIDEIFYLLNNDINECINELIPYPWFLNQDEVRKGVLIELCFNLGLHGLLEFNQFLISMNAKDFELANKNLIDSKWSKEVQPERVRDISYRLLKGVYQ